MAMIAGTIDVTDPENVTGTGLAFAMFEGSLSTVPAANKAAIAAGMKPYFEGLAAAIVNHIKDNAEITVTVQTTDSGLQRTPNPNNPDTDCQGPSGDKTLTGTIE